MWIRHHNNSPDFLWRSGPQFWWSLQLNMVEYVGGVGGFGIFCLCSTIWTRLNVKVVGRLRRRKIWRMFGISCKSYSSACFQLSPCLFLIIFAAKTSSILQEDLEGTPLGTWIFSSWILWSKLPTFPQGEYHWKACSWLDSVISSACLGSRSD